MRRLAVMLVVGGVALAIALKGAAIAQVTDPATGHTYQRISPGGSYSWHQARDSALALGGHLATITSQSEFDLVAQLLPDFPTSEVVYLGGKDENEEGNWVWVTGESWGYSHWLSGQPDNSQGIQDWSGPVFVDTLLVGFGRDLRFKLGWADVAEC